MKRGAALLWGAVALMILPGCQNGFLPRGHDLRTVELMQTMGADVGEDTAYRLTTSGGVTRSEGENQPPVVMTGQGDSLYESVLDIETQSENYVSFGHVGYLLVGEELAERGLSDVEDYLERDTELRMNTETFVVRDGSAADAIRAGGSEQSAVSERLEAMELDARLAGRTTAYSLMDLITAAGETGCGLLPAVRVEREKLVSAGYACVRDGRLIGWLEEEQAPGVNLLAGDLEGGIASGYLSDGTMVSLRLERADCRWEVDRVTHTITAAAEIKAGLEEVHGHPDLTDPAVWREMDGILGNYFERQAGLVLERCEEMQADVLNIRGRAALAAWDTALCAQSGQEFWDSWTVKAEACGRVDRTYDIVDSGQEGE